MIVGIEPLSSRDAATLLHGLVKAEPLCEALGEASMDFNPNGKAVESFYGSCEHLQKRRLLLLCPEEGLEVELDCSNKDSTSPRHRAIVRTKRPRITELEFIQWGCISESMPTHYNLHSLMVLWIVKSRAFPSFNCIAHIWLPYTACSINRYCQTST